jgi:hypothetical protein
VDRQEGREVISEESVPSRQQKEWLVDYICKLFSELNDQDIDDQGENVEERDSTPRRTRRDYATAERPDRHRDRWDEIEMEAALALSGIGWSRYKIGELLDRAPEAVRRIVQRQRDAQ